MKCFVVSSAEFMRYDNWSVHFHYMLKTSRERAADREEAFWKYMAEIKKLTMADVYRLIREQPDEAHVLSEIETILLPVKRQRRLTPDEWEALRDTVRAIVQTYLLKQQAEIASQQEAMSKLKVKFDERSTPVRPERPAETPIP